MLKRIFNSERIFASHCLILANIFFKIFVLCRASMHSFFIDCQSLRELRITGVLIIEATQKEMWVGSKCNGPVNFFSERRYFKHNTCVFPHCPPPPPPNKLHLLSLVTPPPPSSAFVVKQGHLWLWGSDRGVLSREGWPIKCDRGSWHIWWIRAVGEFGRSTGDRRWPTATPPPPRPVSLDVPGQGLETNGGGEGGA